MNRWQQTRFVSAIEFHLHSEMLVGDARHPSTQIPQTCREGNLNEALFISTPLKNPPTTHAPETMQRSTHNPSSRALTAASRFTQYG